MSTTIPDPFVQLVRILNKDIVHHQFSEDGHTWPLNARECKRDLCDAFLLPSWVKKVNCVAGVDGIDQKLWNSFNSTLSDCASLRHVMDSECRHGTQNPKESFLTVLVRNILCFSDEKLVSQEDVLVALARPSCGDYTSFLKYMPSSVRAALVISICEDVILPDDESRQPEGQVNLLRSTNSSVTGPCIMPQHRMTMSEFLEACAEPRAVENPKEDSELDEDEGCPIDLEAHFLGYSPSIAIPEVCCLPILCMAEEDDLPLLMSSMLYQRRVWRISEPLIGVAFSRYDSYLRFSLGWLENSSFDRTLPQVHIGHIDISPHMDLSDPLISLAVSRILFSLEDHISKVRASACQTAATVSTEIQQESIFSWRLDSAIMDDDASPPIEDHQKRVVLWLDNLGYKPPLTRCAISALLGPYRLSVLSDDDMCNEYNHLTNFIWPKDWNSRVSIFRFPKVPPSHELSQENLPHADSHLQPSVDLLYRQVEAYKKLGRTDRSLISDFPEECSEQLLSILSGSFSAIFQACSQAREKAGFTGNMPEAQWRHDHDRLFFDFFRRTLEQSGSQHQRPAAKDKEGPGGTSEEEPQTHTSLERMLRFPASFFASNPGGKDLFVDFIQKTSARRGAVKKWATLRGHSDLLAASQEIHDYAHFVGHAALWEGASEDHTLLMRRLGEDPLQGKCDALGTLFVNLPHIKHATLDKFHLSSIPEPSASYETKKLEAYRRMATADVKAKEEVDEKGEAAVRKMKGKGMQKAGPSSQRLSVSPAMSSLDLVGDKTVDSMVDDPQHISIDSPGPLMAGAMLELPLLVLKHKPPDGESAKCINQNRMYSVAIARFLEAVGITDFLVFSALSDGPQVLLPGVCVKEGIVYIFERNTQSFDISTPLGAWHYATVLCRIAVMQSKKLLGRFEEVRDEFLQQVNGEDGKGLKEWTLDDQITAFGIDHIAVRGVP
ncbi:hypothetical protein B0H21DRAFT_700154 [Amylocystis lapponica]|nr:hypothetical protein B0H21DRAFT_700154 [Amylocystis lapponica]